MSRKKQMRDITEKNVTTMKYNVDYMERVKLTWFSPKRILDCE
jgi:hypothetical protein